VRVLVAGCDHLPVARTLLSVVKWAATVTVWFRSALNVLWLLGPIDW